MELVIDFSLFGTESTTKFRKKDVLSVNTNLFEREVPEVHCLNVARLKQVACVATIKVGITNLAYEG
jgi:hypothetical protein